MTSRIYDFRGGYASSTPPEQMAANEVLTGTNLYYDGKLKKRPSWANYCTNATITAQAVLGMGSAYMNGAWENVVALNNSGTISFYTLASATALDAALTTPASVAFTWAGTADIEMVEFNDMIVAVNGVDKPAIIYYDGTKISIQKLENYDSRSRGNDDWYAGQWDNSGASPALQFIDDTTDAQDVGTDDFQLCAANQNADGFYVAGVLPFTKIVMTNADAFSSEPSDETYQYYAGGGTWSNVTLVSSPTWGTGGGDKTIEFNIPLDSNGDLAWKKYGDVSTDADPTGVPGGALNRYIFRVSFVTAPTNTPNCDKLTVSHEQYLTQIFQNDIPDVVAVHKDRLFLAVGNVFRFSPPNSLKNWDSRDIEYLDEGGNNIVAMHSGGNFLAIVKEFGWYRYYGTTTANFVLRFGGPEGGVSARGIAAMKEGVVYLSVDGVRFIPYEGAAALISKSIASDLAPAAGDIIINYRGDIIMSDPSADTLWWADPDTLRMDDMGDGRISWWKWINQNCENLIYAKDITGAALLLAYDADNTRLVKNGTAAFDTDKAGTGNTNIACTLKSKYYSFGEPNMKKRFLRFKSDISKSGDWTLTFISDNGVTTSTAVTLTSGTGTGHYYGDTSIPWQQDGYNIAFQLANQTANTVEIYGFSVEWERRAF